MAYFNLRIVSDGRILSDATAVNPDGALDVFGRELGVKLTFTENDGAPPYLFEVWSAGPHWVNPTIPVYEA